MNISSGAVLALQLFIILAFAGFFRYLTKKMGLPVFLGYLTAGIITGPFILGKISLPGFPEGLFANTDNGLYAIQGIACIMLFFFTGLRINFMMLRGSLAGLLAGVFGAIISFFSGSIVLILVPDAGFNTALQFFPGLVMAAMSVGLASEILWEHKKLNSPEGVTITASAEAGAFLSVSGFIIITILCQSGIFGFYNIGEFQNQGLTGIIVIAVVFIAGLLLSNKKAAIKILKQYRSIKKISAAIFFTTLGMLINPKEMFTWQVIVTGLIFAITAVTAKLAGGGGSSLLLGFNVRGALRVGTGLIAGGEAALIITGTGLMFGITGHYLFYSLLLMIFFTALAATILLKRSLKMPGRGTRNLTRGDDSISASWDFPPGEPAGMASDILLTRLKNSGFHIKITDTEKNLWLAKKANIALSICYDEKNLNTEADAADAVFVRSSVNEVISGLGNSILKGKPPDIKAFDRAAKKTLTNEELLSLIKPECISVALNGTTKKEIITEMAGILATKNKLINRDLVLNDLLKREKIMSTGMQLGIALPHATTAGTDKLMAAVGIKKEGVDFESADGEKSKIFVMIISPKNKSSQHIQFLAAISAILKEDKLRNNLINCATPEEAACIFLSEEN